MVSDSLQAMFEQVDDHAFTGFLYLKIEKEGSKKRNKGRRIEDRKFQRKKRNVIWLKMIK